MYFSLLVFVLVLHFCDRISEAGYLIKKRVAYSFGGWKSKQPGTSSGEAPPAGCHHDCAIFKSYIFLKVSDIYFFLIRKIRTLPVFFGSSGD
jgi:hypothetical protein